MSTSSATAGAVLTAVSCVNCGARAETPPLTWPTSVESGRLQYLCDQCTRDNLRAIEARLDTAW